jgi:hypothetical protein
MSDPLKAVVLEEPLSPAWYSSLAAPFSWWHRGVVELTKLPMSEQVMVYHIVSVGTPPVVLVKNSKAGCTTLAQVLYFSKTGTFYDGRIHEEGKILTQGQMAWARARADVAAPDRFLVTSVRNPHDRAYSAFRDFLLDKKNPSTNRHMDGLVAFGLDHNKDEDYNFDVFLDYVEASIAKDRYLTDRHWREQVVNTSFDSLDYDLVLRVERFAQDLTLMLDALKIPAAQHQMILEAKFNKSAAQIEFGAHHHHRIESIYAADMDAFEY